MSPFWGNFRHWLHRKLSKWHFWLNRKLLKVTKISSKFIFDVSVISCDHTNLYSCVNICGDAQVPCDQLEWINAPHIYMHKFCPRSDAPACKETILFSDPSDTNNAMITSQLRQSDVLYQKTMPISHQLMPWLLVSTGHQQAWHWPHYTFSIFSWVLKANFKYLRRHNFKKLYKTEMHSLFLKTF